MCAALVLTAVFTYVCVCVMPQEETGRGMDVGAVEMSLPDEEGYRDKIACLFSGDKWSELYLDEKLDALQLICDWENVKVLGCSPVQVRLEEMSRENLGYYSHSDGAVYLNCAMVAGQSWQRTLDTLLHECRHCWQRDMISLLIQVEEDGSGLERLYIFNEARDFRDGWNNYTSGLEDYDVYYDQFIERDSRQWASSRMLEYYLPAAGEGAQ